MDEPGLLLRGVTYHFASGHALWVGLALVLLAVRAEGWKWPASRVTLLGLLGLIWIALSGWPAFWLQVLLFAVVAAWLFRSLLPPGQLKAQLPACVVVMVVVVLLRELPWLVGPVRPIGPVAALAVIGDSVTAGLNDRDVTWPRVLASEGACTIYDASQQGATVKSAHEQLTRLQGRGDALLIEIGGNDLLEGLSPDLFAARLETLLQAARPQYPTIVMLELPLPPFANRYGAIQRGLARRYHIAVLPKREFIGVLTAAGSTVDGIHLSNRGQERMAGVVRSWLRLPTTASAPVEYVRVDVR
jgi:acyl-CoA thioesterase I